VAFLKRSRRRKNGELYESWAIVESIRTPRGPRQRTIATLGKGPGLDQEQRLTWDQVCRQLSGKPSAQPDLFDQPDDDSPELAVVDLKRVRVERVRRFGDVYLALHLWSRLRLDKFFDTRLPKGEETVAWSLMARIHAVARLVEPSSDLAIADSFYPATALDDLVGVPETLIYDNRLYRALGPLLECREDLFAHLKTIYGQLFSSQFDLLLYDVTSTYFEGRCERNTKARRGHSRDSRPDCKQVTIGLVVTPDGLPLAYEVFPGNCPDVGTLGDIFELMEKKYGKARRVWVLDRGIVSEENLAALRAQGADYIVGTPRTKLRHYESELTETKDWSEVEPGVEVKLVEVPASAEDKDPGGKEVFVLCRSRDRIAKDQAIVERAASALEKELLNMERQIEAGKLKDRGKAERRIGRLLQKYSRAARLFDVKVEEQQVEGKSRLVFHADRLAERDQWVSLQNGCYLLRSNLVGKDAGELWRSYIGLVEAEDAFRQWKSPLALRPVYHQRGERVEGHILVCFLALVMRRCLGLWMEESGLGNSPGKLLEQLRSVTSMDVVLGAPSGEQIRLRVVSTPEERVRVLLHHFGLRLPNRPKRIADVVATFASGESCAQ
jgi:transposase